MVEPGVYGQTFTPELLDPSPGNSGTALLDHDNDGDLDLLHLHDGFSILVNDGSGNFTEAYYPFFNRLDHPSMDMADFDNDGDVDIAVTGAASDAFFTRLYRNNNGVFYPADTLSGGRWGSVNWGDLDRDGLLDLVVSGMEVMDKPFFHMYMNRDEKGFELLKTNIPPLSLGNQDLGDFDNDGDLDILYSGLDYSGNRNTTIFRNEGDASFVELYDVNLPGVNRGYSCWADFTGDGLLDVIVSGRLINFENITELYENNGDGTFTKLEAGFVGVSDGYVDWADYDNDGFLDFLISGSSGSLYRNEGDGSFQVTEDFFESFKRRHTIAWGDLDGDLDLDFVTMDNLYRNNGEEGNSAPAIPGGLHAYTIASDVFLDWEQVSDAETPTDALSYNVEFYRMDDLHPLLKTAVDSLTGYLRLPETGNAGHANHFVVRNLSTGKYIWRVQAIDNGYLASPFSMYDTIEVKPFFTDSEFIFPGIRNSSAAWGDCDNDGDLDLVLCGFCDNSDTDTLVVYENRNGAFSEEYSTGYQGMSNGDLAWGDFDNDGDLDLIVTGSGLTELFRNDGDFSFNAMDQPDFPGLFFSAVYCNDMDNDGDLDLILSGTTGPHGSDPLEIDTITQVYLNQGNNTFHQITGTNFPGLSRAHFSGADYDRDMDTDILVTGRNVKEEKTTILFENMGGMEFSIRKDVDFIQVMGMSDWGDHDLDGDLDVVVAGIDNEMNKKTAIYRNDDGVFTDIHAVIRGVLGSARWADYNRDGYPDLLLSGSSGEDIVNFFANDGSGRFTEVDYGLPGIMNGEALLGDYNNDQNLDVFICGRYDEDAYSGLYQSNLFYPAYRPVQVKELSSERNSEGIILRWEQDGAEGLSYNVRVGSSPGGIDIVVPFSNSVTGETILPVSGNTGLTDQWFVSYERRGTFYWSVQAVDQSFIGGEWAPEETFSMESLYAYFEADTVCQGEFIKFNDQSHSSDSEIESWYWDFGDGFSSSERNPEHQYQSPGTYEVRLEIANATDTDWFVSNIAVQPVPAPDFSFKTAELGSYTSFFNTTADIDDVHNWSWDLGDGTYYAGENPQVHLYDASGEYSVTLTATSKTGCSASLSKNLTICDEYMDSPGIHIHGPVVIYLACSNDSAAYYRWYRNDELIPGAEDYLYLPGKKTGRYRVAVSTSGECYFSSEAIDLSEITSIDEEDPFRNLRLYPNPTPGVFTLEMDNPVMGELIIDIFGENGIRVINIRFQKEIRHFSTRIDLSDQPSAVYLIGLQLEEHRTTRRLIVE